MSDPFKISQKDLDLFKFNYPQHTDLLNRCIRDGDVIITDKPVEGAR